VQTLVNNPTGLAELLSKINFSSSAGTKVGSVSVSEEGEVMDVKKNDGRFPCFKKFRNFVFLLMQQVTKDFNPVKDGIMEKSIDELSYRGPFP
jgi:hypothetical protein